ncbi:serine hydrolase domain-containing protein [Flavobacterium sp. GCM10023249]|uniref:serine hydrolase domain-containing protein n=1 Tax=unclassified Flavobacterium TaxID=196869 RepID=UPI00360BDC28
MKKLMFLISYLMISNFTYSQDDKVDTTVKKIMKDNKIVGLQLAVIKDNKIIKTGHYGLANIEDSIPVDKQTVFSINSITKAFTSVAILQLVEKEKVNFEEPISKYLDSLPNTWENITVKQILTHKSGLPEIFNSEGNLLSENSKILFQRIKESPLTFKPGTELRENQTNYILLGMIIEKISGQSFEKYLAENIFKKAGMKISEDAGLGDFYNIIKHSARPYSFYGSNDLSSVYQPMPTILYPAGGIYSTATEIAQWVIALQNNQLINAENLKTLIKPIELNNGKLFEENGLLNQSSIGFSLSSRAENPIIAANGGARNTLFIYPKKNVSIVVLTNLMGSHPQAFIEEIAKLYIN